LSRGRQAFIVCPRLSAEKEGNLLEEEDEGNLFNDDYAPDMVVMGDNGLPMAAESVFELLQRTELSAFRLGLVHGGMKRPEQEETMRQFREGKLDALVCTSVVEVGVDVPNATIMAILHAERFGLAQLHQLRGRVGRGSEAGKVFLISDARYDAGMGKLMAMTKNSDGFDIAEMDLQMRGAGEFTGVRQSGASGLKLLDLLHDLPVLQEARKEASKLLAADPDLTGPTREALRRELVRQYGENWSSAALG